MVGAQKIITFMKKFQTSSGNPKINLKINSADVKD
jgi:hypothetical protein